MRSVFTVFLLFNLVQSVFEGTVTTWKGDRTGGKCAGARACDGKEKCSALQMSDCECADGKYGITASNTKSTGLNSFKGFCNSPSIDGKRIAAADKARCLSCSLRVCDGTTFPSCATPCYNKVCVNGKVETKVMDACPTNQQKNVAKCCMWGHVDSSYCACVNIIDNVGGMNLDVSGAAMKELLSLFPSTCKGGLCRPASWSNGVCKRDDKPASGGPSPTENVNEAKPRGGSQPVKNSGKPAKPSQGTRLGKTCIVDQNPPSSKYSCAQQAAWRKCNQPWMKGYCCKSCAEKV